MSHTTLYRLYGPNDELLYVGIAGNPGRRFEQHAADKPWWAEVQRTSLEHYDDRMSAASRETADTGGLRCTYACNRCGNQWPCWWTSEPRFL